MGEVSGCTELTCPHHGEENRRKLECGAQYGSNPDRCYHDSGHPGPHSNRYGTTWANATTDPSARPDATWGNK